MPEWAINLISLLAGSGLTLLSGWVADRRAARREREAREEERAEKLRLLRREFQRDSLLKLQEAAMRLARGVGASHYQDVMAFRASGKWQHQKLSDALSEDFRVAMAEVNLLGTRIRDEEVRRLASELREYASQMIISTTEGAAAHALEEAIRRFEQLTIRSGHLIRDLDEPE